MKEGVASLAGYKDRLRWPLEKRVLPAECVDIPSPAQNPNYWAAIFTTVNVGKDLLPTEGRNGRGVISKAMPALNKGTTAWTLPREPVPTHVRRHVQGRHILSMLFSRAHY